MAKTLSQIEKQIQALQREADLLRKKEVAGVVARIQDAIAHYGLSADDLFGTAAARKTRGRASVGETPGRAVAAAPKRAPSPAKYRDEAGHSWSGHGKRPNWFKAALAAGKTAADLAVKA